MVSILKNYYNINLEDTKYFTYKNNNYLLTNKHFTNNYLLYLNLLNNPLSPIKNIYKQTTSNNYTLYQINNLSINNLLNLSLSIITYHKINYYKQNLINNYQHKLPIPSFNKIDNIIIYYIIFTLCQLSIEILNYNYNQTTIPYSFSIDTNLKEENLTIEPLGYNLNKLYYLQKITIKDIKRIIKKQSKDNLIIICCNLIYPYLLLDNKIKDLAEYLNLLSQVIDYFNLSKLNWIKKKLLAI